MKRTTNYDLPTWEKDDFIRMQDFNDLTGKLDAALKSGADAQTALQNAIKAVKATAENAYSSANKPYIAGSYTGNGGTQTVDLGFKPRFLVISRGFDKGDYSADYALFAGTPEHHRHGLYRQDGDLQHLDLSAALAEHRRQDLQLSRTPLSAKKEGPLLGPSFFAVVIRCIRGCWKRSLRRRTDTYR